jgi:hypothetical protein
MEFTSITSRCKYSVDIAYYTPVFNLAGGSIIRYKTFNSEFCANYTGDVLTITAGINYYRNDQLYATQSPHALGITLLGYQFDGFEIYAYGQNLTNRRYASYPVRALYTLTNFVVSPPNDPRTYGIGFRYRY